MSVYFTVSRDSVSFPGERAHLHRWLFHPEQSQGVPSDEFPTLQQAVEAVANLPSHESLDGLRIERHERHERTPRPAIEILEDLLGEVEHALEGYNTDTIALTDLVAEATDRINLGDD